MRTPMKTLSLLTAGLSLLCSATTPASDTSDALFDLETLSVSISPKLGHLDVRHGDETVTILRHQDPTHTIAASYARTSRACPPFCVQPMSLAAGVETIGELELLHYLAAIQRGEFSYQDIWFLLDGKRLFRAARLCPTGAHEPLPAIVVFMGHGKLSQVLSEAKSYQKACAAAFARRGYLVYAMENVGMEPRGDTHLDIDQAMRLYGWSWYSLLFAHSRMLLDEVFRDPMVDRERVGVTGVSTGGFLSLVAGALDPRVAAVSVHGFFGTMRDFFIADSHRHCRCGAVTGLLPEFDLPTLATLVAPRPLHISTAQKDSFRPHAAKQWVERIGVIYRALRGENRYPLFTSPPGGHAYGLEEAMKFFSNTLRKEKR